MIERETTATYYAITDLPSGSISNHHESYPSKAMKTCDTCQEQDLKAEYLYCPNCGRKFSNLNSIS